MKTSRTYRAITVAIGILVAMVIVLTLWIKYPGETAISSFHTSPTSMLPSVMRFISPVIEIDLSVKE